MGMSKGGSANAANPAPTQAPMSPWARMGQSFNRGGYGRPMPQPGAGYNPAGMSTGGADPIMQPNPTRPAPGVQLENPPETIYNNPTRGQPYQQAQFSAGGPDMMPPETVMPQQQQSQPNFASKFSGGPQPRYDMPGIGNFLRGNRQSVYTNQPVPNSGGMPNSYSNAPLPWQASSGMVDGGYGNSGGTPTPTPSPGNPGTPGAPPPAAGGMQPGQQLFDYRWNPTGANDNYTMDFNVPNEGMYQLGGGFGMPQGESLWKILQNGQQVGSGNGYSNPLRLGAGPAQLSLAVNPNNTQVKNRLAAGSGPLMASYFLRALRGY